MSDLDALIEAVEAGADDDVSSLCRSMNRDAHDAGKFWPAHDVFKAYRGSLDAALALHEALLPGWRINVALQPLGEETYCDIIAPLPPTAGKWDFAPRFEARAATPARAWLLAILRAYRDKPPA